MVYEVLSPDEARALIDADKPLFADTETDGFYGEIQVLQLMQHDWEKAVLVLKPDFTDVVSIFANKHLVFQNASYDVSTVQDTIFKRFVPENLDDILYLARLHWPDKDSYTLDNILAYGLGFDPYVEANLDKKKLQKSKWTGKLTDDQLLYAALDVYHLPTIWDGLKYLLEDFNYRLDILALKHALKFQINGLPVDEEKRAAEYETCEARLAELACPINVNSYQQVRRYIGEEESDDAALARFSAGGNKKAAQVREARGIRKTISFLEKYDKPRITGKFAPSARSGRFTCKDDNLQQTPRRLKKIFGHPQGSDKVLIFADYAQLELRTIAAITKCSRMIELFNSGEDLHGFTAAYMFNEDYTKEERRLSKTYNFILVYGGGISMVQQYIMTNLGTHMEEGVINRDRRKWRRLWPEIYSWQQKGMRDYQLGRLGSTPAGRFYRAKMTTDQLNIENQGAGADVAKLALHYLMTELAKRPELKDVLLCNMVHDSFMLEAPNEPAVYEEASQLLARCMQKAWFEYSKYLPIKDLAMPVNVAVDFNLADCDNDEISHLYDFAIDPWEMLTNEI